MGIQQPLYFLLKEHHAIHRCSAEMRHSDWGGFGIFKLDAD
jgi:hypothetical protein